ncbi:MAG: hypothetical protein ABEK50_15530 [bacterium]
MKWITEEKASLSLSRLSVLGLLGLFTILLSFMVLSSLHEDSARAEMRKLSNDELRDVSGSGLFHFIAENGTTDVTKSVGNLGGAELNVNTTEWTYTRLETDIQITGNFTSGNQVARIKNLRIGHYDDSNSPTNGGSSTITDHNADGFCTDNEGSCEGQGTSFVNPDGNAGWDEDMGDFSLGRSGPNQNFDQPAIRGPYIELVWDKMQDSDPTNNVLMGFRIGFEGIQGGFTIGSASQENLSGYLAGQDFNDTAGANCATHRGNDPVGDGCGNISLFTAGEFGCPGSDSNCSDKGDNDAWTEDLWLSFQKRDIFWEFSNPVLESNNEPDANQAWAKGIDGEGFWIHATDDIEGGLN